MAKPTAGNRTRLYTTLLFALGGIILLALIAVSAFAYQWHSENVELKKQNQGLRAITEQSTFDSMTDQLRDANLNLAAAEAQNEELARKLKQYEQILIENNLMPTATPAAGN